MDLRFGYASFAEDCEAEARALFEAEGLRLRKCARLGDEGEVVAGLPLEVAIPRRQVLA